MGRMFIVDDETKEEILIFNKTRTKEFPRILVRVNQRIDGYSIFIDGPEEDISEFVSKLQDAGVHLEI